MAKVAEGALKNWNDGQVVDAFSYKQEREILKTAINLSDDSIKVIENEIRGNEGISKRMSNAEGRLDTAEPKITTNQANITSLQSRATATEQRSAALETKTKLISSVGENYTGRWHGLTTEDLFNRLLIKPSLLVSPNLKVWEFHVSNSGAISTTEVVDGFNINEVNESIQMRSENGTLWYIKIDDDGLLDTEIVNEVKY